MVSISPKLSILLEKHLSFPTLYRTDDGRRRPKVEEDKPIKKKKVIKILYIKKHRQMIQMMLMKLNMGSKKATKEKRND
jgi:hypothetical protein